MRATSEVTDGYGCVGDIQTQTTSIEDAINKIKELQSPTEIVKAFEELIGAVKVLTSEDGACAKSIGEGNVWFE